MAKKVAKKAAKKVAKKVVKKAAKKKKADDETPAKKKKEAVKKVKKKRATRKKKDVVVRMRLFWGVFNHAMKRIALYEYNQRKAADKKAKEITDSGKPPHFVMKVKEPIEEEVEKSDV